MILRVARGVSDWSFDTSLVASLGLPPKDPHDDEDEEGEENDDEDEEEPAVIREPDEC
jgi:hypothetical protein